MPGMSKIWTYKISPRLFLRLFVIVLIGIGLTVVGWGVTETSKSESLVKFLNLDEENLPPNTYYYTRQFSSWTGFGNMTKIQVVDGRVVQREYLARSENGFPTESWTERGDKIGSHRSGHDPKTMLELVDECNSSIVPRIGRNDTSKVEYSGPGVLQACYYIPFGCQDDCLVGITIAEYGEGFRG